MPSISTAPSDDLLEPFESFAILNKDNLPALADAPAGGGRMPHEASVEAAAAKYKNVNVVKPVQRKPPNEPDPIVRNSNFERRNVRIVENLNETQNHGKKRNKTMDVLAPSHTILDPRFSRKLDLKLRRLKEKEIIAERLSRRAKEKAKVNSIHKVQIRSVPPNTKKMSNSYPNVSLIKPTIVNLELRNFKMTENDEKILNGGKFHGVSKAGRHKRLAYSNESVNNRPLFITTVKKGLFLLPPPEMASLLGLEGYVDSAVSALDAPMVYSYASRPKVVAPPPPPPSLPPLVEPKPPKASLGGAARALAALASLAAGTAAVGSSGCPQPRGFTSDKRTIRGSTLSIGNMGAGGDTAGEARRRAVARRRAPRSTAPPEDLPYKAVQTEPYLEELFDKGEEFDVGVQTDLLVERPTTPKFIPAKIGHDVATQIWPGDLFDFDEEVAPILEVLVGKTIEQALAEVLEEEELAAVKRRAAEAAERRAAVAASAAHHQRHLVRMHRQKERRLEEAALGTEAARSAAQRAAAATLVRAHLPALLPAVLRSLQDQGFLQPDQDPGVDEGFMPWLLSEVAQEVETMITSRDVLTDIVKEILETRAEVFRAMGEGEASSVSSSEPSQEQQEYQEILGENDHSDNISDA